MVLDFNYYDCDLQNFYIEDEREGIEIGNFSFKVFI